MRNTRAYSTRYSQREVLDRYAFGYIQNEAGGWELPSTDNSAAYAVWLSGIEGDGNVVSTLDDIVRWDAALREHTLITETTWREATSGAQLQDGTMTDYGFGWNLEVAADGTPIHNHTGGWPGTQAMICRHAATQRLIFYVKNRETNDWSWLGRLDALVNGVESAADAK